ncbi:SMC1 [Candida margitis]|uniref:SMC1 n=1 Tax=Candida margitis TaxID=1775924 RepID=UPI002227861A|nr:SMC1 [Candida margitis]KAI5967666.1 SMC1 [Candida margitis]
MGRLLGLELNNFKSYRGNTKIGFGSSSNFVSIIGPNGSGKSNMMDAISFVLGLNSAQLRSRQIKDLIYRGRRDTLGDLDDTAVDIEQDPRSAYVLAVYEKDNGEILRLKRSISATGSTDYQIDDQSVTKLNYTATLKQENILVKARNFLVFQGDVEQIASQNPKDLSAMIEHISGSNEYVDEYARLKDEMDKAHEVTNEVFSRKRTLNSESKQYKEQASEQRQFEKSLVLRNDLVKKLNLYQLYHNENKHHKLNDEIRSKQDQLKDMKNALAKKEQTFKSLTSEYSKTALELKNYTKQIEQSNQKVESTKRGLIPVESSKASLSSKIKSSENKVSDLEVDIASQKAQIKSLEKQLRDSKKLFKDFEEQVRVSISASSKLNIPEDGQEEYEKLRAEYLAASGSELEEQISLLVNEKDSLTIKEKSLTSQKSNTESRMQDLQSSLNLELKSKLNDLDNEISQVLNKKREKNDVRSKLIEQKDVFNQKELEINTELKEVLLKLEDLSSQQRASNKQKKLRENISTLKRLLPAGSIKGLVHELVRPAEQKYEYALSTILGRNSDAIIVETAAIAYRCIDILKERRAGVATFIPLDSVEFDPVNLSYLRSISDSAVPGMDIVEYEDKLLGPAVEYIVGNSLVADDINVARSLRWNSSKKFENKIVTLQGSVIHKSGQMTGGQQTRKSSANISWDKQEWTKLNDRKESLLSEVLKLQETRPKELEINLLADEISQLDDKLPILKNQKASLDRAINDKISEINFQKEQCKTYAESLEKMRTEFKEIGAKIAKFEKEIKKQKSVIYKDFCKKWGIKDGIEKYEELHGTALRTRAKERALFLKSISVLQNRLDFETSRCEETESRKSSITNQIVDLREELENVVEEKQRLEENLDNVQAESEILRKERKKVASLLETKMRSSKLVENDVAEASSEVTNLTKEIIQKEETLLKVDSIRANILKHCKIQNIILPLDAGDLDCISMGEDSDEILGEIYKIEIDYEMLDQKYKDTFSPKLEAELEVMLQNTIESLEKLTPNAKAMERFKEVENKLRGYDKDYTVARQKERKAADRFREISEKRYDKFMEAFNHISGCIDATYKELTKSNLSPMGGSAFLILEDEDTPYLSGVKYHAMPPMKRFQDMELLSGGEKTMAALALLFALHSFQPAPFFVLDEIDAALDNSNVGKIGNYIKNHAGPNFQFIVISLKNNLYEKSDALVGIYREQRQNSSKTVTLDLSEYPDEDMPLQGNPVAAA